jgi:hypothetical protein
MDAGQVIVKLTKAKFERGPAMIRDNIIVKKPKPYTQNL